MPAVMAYHDAEGGGKELFALVLLLSSMADNSVSPGLVLWGKGRDAGCSIVQALCIAASVVGSCQYGLDIEHNVRVGRRQRETYAREPVAQ